MAHGKQETDYIRDAVLSKSTLEMDRSSDRDFPGRLEANVVLRNLRSEAYRSLALTKQNAESLEGELASKAFPFKIAELAPSANAELPSSFSDAMNSVNFGGVCEFILDVVLANYVLLYLRLLSSNCRVVAAASTPGGDPRTLLTVALMQRDAGEDEGVGGIGKRVSFSLFLIKTQLGALGESISDSSDANSFQVGHNLFRVLKETPDVGRDIGIDGLDYQRATPFGFEDLDIPVDEMITSLSIASADSGELPFNPLWSLIGDNSPLVILEGAVLSSCATGAGERGEVDEVDEVDEVSTVAESVATCYAALTERVVVEVISDDGETDREGETEIVFGFYPTVESVSCPGEEAMFPRRLVHLDVDQRLPVCELRQRLGIEKDGRHPGPPSMLLRLIVRGGSKTGRGFGAGTGSSASGSVSTGLGVGVRAGAGTSSAETLEVFFHVPYGTASISVTLDTISGQQTRAHTSKLSGRVAERVAKWAVKNKLPFHAAPVYDKDTFAVADGVLQRLDLTSAGGDASNAEEEEGDPEYYGLASLVTKRGLVVVLWDAARRRIAFFEATSGDGVKEIVIPAYARGAPSWEAAFGVATSTGPRNAMMWIHTSDNSALLDIAHPIGQGSTRIWLVSSPANNDGRYIFAGLYASQGAEGRWVMAGSVAGDSESGPYDLWRVQEAGEEKVGRFQSLQGNIGGTEGVTFLPGKRLALATNSFVSFLPKWGTSQLRQSPHESPVLGLVCETAGGAIRILEVAEIPMPDSRLMVMAMEIESAHRNDMLPLPAARLPVRSFHVFVSDGNDILQRLVDIPVVLFAGGNKGGVDWVQIKGAILCVEVKLKASTTASGEGASGVVVCPFIPLEIFVADTSRCPLTNVAFREDRDDRLVVRHSCVSSDFTCMAIVYDRPALRKRDPELTPVLRVLVNGGGDHFRPVVVETGLSDIFQGLGIPSLSSNSIRSVAVHGKAMNAVSVVNPSSKTRAAGASGGGGGALAVVVVSGIAYTWRLTIYAGKAKDASDGGSVSCIVSQTSGGNVTAAEVGAHSTLALECFESVSGTGMDDKGNVSRPVTVYLANQIDFGGGKAGDWMADTRAVTEVKALEEDMRRAMKKKWKAALSAQALATPTGLSWNANPMTIPATRDRLMGIVKDTAAKVPCVIPDDVARAQVCVFAKIVEELLVDWSKESEVVDIGQGVNDVLARIRTAFTLLPAVQAMLDTVLLKIIMQQWLVDTASTKSGSSVHHVSVNFLAPLDERQRCIGQLADRIGAVAQRRYGTLDRISEKIPVPTVPNTVQEKGVDESRGGPPSKVRPRLTMQTAVAVSIARSQGSVGFNSNRPASSERMKSNTDTVAISKQVPSKTAKPRAGAGAPSTLSRGMGTDLSSD